MRGLCRENKKNYLRINPYLSTLSGALLRTVYHEVAASQLPGREPTVVDMAPVPAHESKIQ